MTVLYIFRLDDFYVDRVQAFFAFLNFKFNFVVLADLVDQTRRVYEDVFPTSIGLNESESFRLIKEFYYSCLHLTCFERSKIERICINNQFFKKIFAKILR